jgi:cytochrome c
MKRLCAALVIVCCVAGFAHAADEKALPEDAVAMVEQAAQYIEQHGLKEACQEFCNPQGEFIKGDMYLFVVDRAGKCLANGGFPDLVGKNLMWMPSRDKKMMVREMILFTRYNPHGWIVYKWENPVTKQVAEKSTYYRKVGDVVIGCGVYE